MKLQETGALKPSWRAFLLLCEAQSFSNVAKTVGISQSALSKTIKGIESELGFPLFDRTKRPIVPTPEALLLREELLVMSAGIDAKIKKLRLQKDLRPTLRFGCVDSVCRFIVPALINHFEDSLSKFSQITANSGILIKKLLSNELDVILVSGSFDEISGLYRRKIFTEPSLIVLPPKFEAIEKEWSWQDLQKLELPLLSSSESSEAKRLNERFLSSSRLHFFSPYQIDSDEIMISLIESGIGWAITRPSTLLASRKDKLSVSLLPLPKGSFDRHLYLMSKENFFIPEVNTIESVCKLVLQSEIKPLLKDLLKYTELFQLAKQIK